MTTQIGEGQVNVKLNSSDLLGQTKGVLAAMGVEFGKFGELAGVALGVAAVAAVGKELLSIGDTMADVTSTIRTETGATGRALDGLVDAAKGVATHVPVSFHDAAAAVGELHAALGLSGPAVEKVAIELANLSVLTKTDLAGDVTQITALLNRFGISTNRLPGILNEVFRAFQHTGVPINTLIGDLITGEPVLRDWGQSFSQQLAEIASWEKHGLNVSSILSGMRLGFSNLSKVTTDSSTKLKDLAESLGLPEKELVRLSHNPAEAFKVLTAQIQDAKSSIDATRVAVELFGSRAGVELVKGLRSGGAATAQLQHQIEFGRQTINQTAQATRTWQQWLQILWNEIQNDVAPAAKWLSDKLTMVAEVMAKGLPRAIAQVKHDFQTLPGPVKAVFTEVVTIAKIEVGLVLDQVKHAFRLIIDTVDLFGDLLHGRWYTAWQDVVNILRNAFFLIRDEVLEKLGLIGDLIIQFGPIVYRDALQLGESIVHGIEHGITSIASGIAHDITSAAGNALSGAAGILGMASGGIVTRPTLAVVGESGPEAVVPLRGLATGASAITPLPAGLGGAGNVTVVVNVGNEQLGSYVAEQVTAQQARVAQRLLAGAGAVWGSA